MPTQIFRENITVVDNFFSMNFPHCAVLPTHNSQCENLETFSHDFFRKINVFFHNFRSDENVMLLLSAIALFNPDRSNVVHKDVVKKEQVSHVSHVSQVKLVMLVILVMSVKLV